MAKAKVKHKQVKKSPQQKVGAYVHRHRFVIATFTTVGIGVLGIVAAGKMLPVGAATAVGIGIGYLTVTAVGGIGAMAMKDGSVKLQAAVEKSHAPA